MAGNPPQTLWGGSFHFIFKCKNYDFLKKKTHLGVAVFWQWIIRGGSLVSLTESVHFRSLNVGYMGWQFSITDRGGGSLVSLTGSGNLQILKIFITTVKVIFLFKKLCLFLHLKME